MNERMKSKNEDEKKKRKMKLKQHHMAIKKEGKRERMKEGKKLSSPSRKPLWVVKDAAETKRRNKKSSKKVSVKEVLGIVSWSAFRPAVAARLEKESKGQVKMNSTATRTTRTTTRTTKKWGGGGGKRNGNSKKG